jgi:hypothetical protein
LLIAGVRHDGFVDAVEIFGGVIIDLDPATLSFGLFDDSARAFNTFCASPESPL